MGYINIKTLQMINNKMFVDSLLLIGCGINYLKN